MAHPDLAEIIVGFTVRRQQFGRYAHRTLRRSGDSEMSQAVTLVVWETRTAQARKLYSHCSAMRGSTTGRRAGPQHAKTATRIKRRNTAVSAFSPSFARKIKRVRSCNSS